MDWESKFSSIVQETESNLAKVEQRLGRSTETLLSSAVTSNTVHRSSRDAASTLNNASSAAPLSSSSFCYGESFKNNLTKAKSLRSLPSRYDSFNFGSSNVYMDEAPNVYAALDQSEGVATVLQDRIDEQNRMLKEMSQSIQTLREERNTYQKQLRELREEMGSIKKSKSQKDETWKDDIMTEIALLQSQLKLKKPATDSLLRESREAQRSQQANLRKEVDSLGSRLMKLELTVRELQYDKQDTTRQHERLNKSINNLIEAQLSSTKNYSLDTKDEINELRSSYRTLRDKLDKVQTEIHPPIKKPPKAPQKKVGRPMIDLLSPNTSDIELDLSLDSEVPDITLDGTNLQTSVLNTDDALDQLNTEGLETVDLRLTTTNDLDLTGDELTDIEGEPLSMDELK